MCASVPRIDSYDTMMIMANWYFTLAIITDKHSAISHVKPYKILKSCIGVSVL